MTGTIFSLQNRGRVYKVHVTLLRQNPLYHYPVILLVYHNYVRNIPALSLDRSLLPLNANHDIELGDLESLIDIAMHTV